MSLWRVCALHSVPRRMKSSIVQIELRHRCEIFYGNRTVCLPQNHIPMREMCMEPAYNREKYVNLLLQNIDGKLLYYSEWTRTDWKSDGIPNRKLNLWVWGAEVSIHYIRRIVYRYNCLRTVGVWVWIPQDIRQRDYLFSNLHWRSYDDTSTILRIFGNGKARFRIFEFHWRHCRGWRNLFSLCKIVLICVSHYNFKEHACNYTLYLFYKRTTHNQCTKCFQ